jgi:hypothetical protein
MPAHPRTCYVMGSARLSLNSAFQRLTSRALTHAPLGVVFFLFFFLVMLVKQATMERLNAMLVVSEGAMVRDTSGEVEFDDAD